MNENIIVFENKNKFKDLSSKVKLNGFNIIGSKISEDLDDTKLDNAVRKLSEYTSIKAIIIPIKIGNGAYDGLRLGLHIRFTQSIGVFRLVPLLFLSTQNYIDFINITPLANFLLFEGSHLIDFDINKIKDVLLNSKSISENDLLTITNDLVMEKEDEVGSHSITNIWGASQLSEISGIPIALSEKAGYSKFFFKFLKTKQELELRSIIQTVSIEEENLVIKPLRHKKKILLIDDEHFYGWKSLINNIIKKFNVENELTVIPKSIDKKESIFEDSINELKENYDLIFLDLRIKSEDQEPINKDLKDLYGTKLLQIIKDTTSGNPSTQVVIFTASNKAWNMKGLIDLGADGYFIKESPDFYNILAYSKENYLNLLKTINHAFKKENVLNIFWEKINLLEQKIDNNQSLLFEKNSSNIKGRIKERIRMFFGLLKRNYEDSIYNVTNFFYSDIELSFMTLWSCLNDIQYCYFNKTPNLMHTNKIDWILESNLINTINTKLSSPVTINDKFIDFTSGNAQSFLAYDPNVSPYFTLNPTPHSFNGLQRSTSLQIGYIILTLSILSTNIDYLLENLKKLNELRNKLYLIHGDEDLTSDFFKKEIKNIRNSAGIGSSKVEIKNCAELFEIIFFLVTGIKITII
jgi:DNA-binding NarL/FixJ family response regulator